MALLLMGPWGCLKAPCNVDGDCRSDSHCHPETKKCESGKPNPVPSSSSGGNSSSSAVSSASSSLPSSLVPSSSQTTSSSSGVATSSAVSSSSAGASSVSSSGTSTSTGTSSGQCGPWVPSHTCDGGPCDEVLLEGLIRPRALTIHPTGIYMIEALGAQNVHTVRRFFDGGVAWDNSYLNQAADLTLGPTEFFLSNPSANDIHSYDAVSGFPDGGGNYRMAVPGQPYNLGATSTFLGVGAADLLADGGARGLVLVMNLDNTLREIVGAYPLDQNLAAVTGFREQLLWVRQVGNRGHVHTWSQQAGTTEVLVAEAQQLMDVDSDGVCIYYVEKDPNTPSIGTVRRFLPRQARFTDAGLDSPVAETLFDAPGATSLQVTDAGFYWLEEGTGANGRLHHVPW